MFEIEDYLDMRGFIHLGGTPLETIRHQSLVMVDAFSCGIRIHEQRCAARLAAMGPRKRKDAVPTALRARMYLQADTGPYTPRREDEEVEGASLRVQLDVVAWSGHYWIRAADTEDLEAPVWVSCGASMFDLESAIFGKIEWATHMVDERLPMDFWGSLERRVLQVRLASMGEMFEEGRAVFREGSDHELVEFRRDVHPM